MALAPPQLQSASEFPHTDWGADMFLFSLGSESPKGAIGHIIATEKNILAVEKNKVLLPPAWSRIFSWGFDDFSCCLGTYGSDKVRSHSLPPADRRGWGTRLCPCLGDRDSWGPSKTLSDQDLTPCLTAWGLQPGCAQGHLQRGSGQPCGYLELMWTLTPSLWKVRDFCCPGQCVGLELC